MLTNFFKPKWQHTDPAKRVQAINKLNSHNEKDNKILTNIAFNDDNIDVRKIATRKLIDFKVLSDLCHDEDKTISQCAITRFQELIDNKRLYSIALNHTINEGNHQKIINLIKAKFFPKHIAAIALNEITCIEDLKEVVFKSNNITNKRIALDRISDVNTLNIIAKESKSNDKNIFKLSNKKIKDIEAINQQKLNEQNELLSLIKSLETLASKKYFPLYEHKYQHLQNKWKTHKVDLRNTFKDQYETANEKCLLIISNHQQTAQQEINKQNKINDAINKQSGLLEKLKSLSDELTSSTNIKAKALVNTLVEIDVSWKESSKIITASIKDEEIFLNYRRKLKNIESSAKKLLKYEGEIFKYSTTLTETIDQNHKLEEIKKIKQSLSYINRKIKWPKEYAPDDILAKAQDLLKKCDQHIKERKNEEKKCCQKLELKFKFLNAEIRKGNVNASVSLNKDISKLIDSLATEQKKMSYQNRLAHLVKKLEQLKDWKNFATSPKKNLLCEKMESLIDSKENALIIKGEIDALQKQWKLLGHQDTDEDNALWQRFKKAGDQAYQHVKVYYEEVASQKEDNFLKKQALCNKLEDYCKTCDWGHEDWPFIEKLIKTAKREWLTYYPIDKNKSLSITKRFDEIISLIQQHLDGEYRRNHQSMEKLINEVTTLSTSNNLDDAIDKTKNIQQQWKNIGITRYKEANKLRKNFNHICNDIFKRRNQERIEHKEILKKDTDEARLIIRKLREINNNIHPNNNESSKKESLNLFEKFSLLEHIANKDSINFKHNIKKLQQSIKQNIEASMQKKLCQDVEACHNINKDLSMIEKSIEDGSLNKDADTMTKFDEEALDSLDGRLSKPLKTRLKSIKEAISNDGKMPEVNHKAKRKLCIELEIISNIKVAQSDENLKLEVNVERLKKGITSDTDKKDTEDKLKLICNYLSLPYHQDDEKYNLNQRFISASKL